MKKLWKQIRLIGLFLSISLILKSQSVTVETLVAPPYAANISDYLDQSVLKLMNTSNTPLSIMLKGTLTSNNGINGRTKDGYRPLKPIILQPNMPLILQATKQNRVDFLDTKNIDYSAGNYNLVDIVRTGVIPEGTYEVCINAYDYATGQTVLSKQATGTTNCRSFNIILPQPPVIDCDANAPLLNGVESLAISAMMPPGARQQVQTFIRFNWLPANANGKNIMVAYDLYVLKLQDGQNPQDAMQAAILNKQNNPIVFRDIRTPQYDALLAQTPSLVSGRYAWAVVAKDGGGGQTRFENNGVSQICAFEWTKMEKPIVINPAVLQNYTNRVNGLNNISSITNSTLVNNGSIVSEYTVLSTKKEIIVSLTDIPHGDCDLFGWVTVQPFNDRNQPLPEFQILDYPKNSLKWVENSGSWNPTGHFERVSDWAFYGESDPYLHGGSCEDSKIAFFKIWFWLNDRDYSPTDYFRLEDACNSRGNFNGGYHYFARVNYDELGVEEEIAIIDGKTPITKKEGVSLDKIYWLCENEKNCNSCRNKSDKAEIIISFKKRTTKELKTNKVDNPVRDINKTAETGVYLGDKPDVTKPIKTTCSYKEPIKVPTAAEINSRCGCSLTDADIQNEVVRATQDIKNFYKNNSKTQKCFYYKGWKDTRDDFMNRKKCNELPWYEIVLANTCCPD